MDSSPSEEANTGVPELPEAAAAPWDLMAECFIFTGYSWSDSVSGGMCDAQEAASLIRKARPHRTLYSVIVYRYSHSPVGPYDELLFIPGFFNVTAFIKGKRKALSRIRITRIYVSTEASIYNGRRNWNIPKHKADFSFEKLAGGRTHIKISKAGATIPFFEVEVLQSQRLPSFPFKWSWLPLDCTLLQPPLPKLSDTLYGEISDSKDTASTPWKEVKFTLNMPNSKIAYIYPKLAGVKSSDKKAYANDVDFPNIAPWTAGLYCPIAKVHFGEPKDIDVE